MPYICKKDDEVFIVNGSFKHINGCIPIFEMKYSHNIGALYLVNVDVNDIGNYTNSYKCDLKYEIQSGIIELYVPSCGYDYNFDKNKSLIAALKTLTDKYIAIMHMDICNGIEAHEILTIIEAICSHMDNLSIKLNEFAKQLDSEEISFGSSVKRAN